jgi:hypothetical protein
MYAITGQRRAGLIWWVGLVTGVYVAGLAVVSHLSRMESGAGIVAVALTVDLVVVVPLAYYLLVLRRGRAPIVTLVPVLVLSALAASRVLPADQQWALRMFEMLAVPLELGLVGWIAWRAARAIREARRDASADPIQQLRRAAFEVTGNDRIAALFASEIAVFSYALGSWRSRAHVPAGTIAFTHHRRSGHGGIVLGFMAVMLAEGLAVHFLLLHWSPLAAWIFTIGTAYGALWLVADYRATVLRPILVGDRNIRLRAGFRFNLEVPLTQVVALSRKRPEFGKESVNLTLLGTPTHWLTLSEPVDAEGPYGFHRRVRAIGIEPDAAAEFDRALQVDPPDSGMQRTAIRAAADAEL